MAEVITREYTELAQSYIVQALTVRGLLTGIAEVLGMLAWIKKGLLIAVLLLLQEKT